MNKYTVLFLSLFILFLARTPLLSQSVLPDDFDQWIESGVEMWENRALREELMQLHMDYEGNIDKLEIRLTLRPMMLQVGAYPSDYYRDVTFIKSIY